MSGRTIFTMAAICVLCATAGAQVTYTQNKSIMVVPGNGAPKPTATLQWFAHAWARDPANPGITAVGQVIPLPQAAGYTNIGGYEGFSTTILPGSGTRSVLRDTVRNAAVRPDKTLGFPPDFGFPPGTAVTAIVPATMGPLAADFDNSATPFRAAVGPADGIPLSAIANASFTVTVPVAANGNTLTALAHVDGSRTSPPPAGAEDYAFSYAAVAYKGKVATPRVWANPAFAIGAQQVAPGAKAMSFATDPVWYTETNANGATVRSDWAQQMQAGVTDNASITWSNPNPNTSSPSSVTMVAGSGGDAFLYFALNPSLLGTAQGGDYTVWLSNGQVMDAEASGVFASLSLPAVGSPLTTWSVSVPQWNYQLPNLADAVNNSFEVDISGNGLTDGTGVPEPGMAVCLVVGAAILGMRRGRR